MMKFISYILLILKSWFGTAIVVPVQQINEHDLDILARTIWGEARGEGYAGMQAVANVVINRFELAQKSPAKARQFGATIRDVCLKRKQFSAWNKNDPNYKRVIAVDETDRQYVTALYLAERAINGTLPDITGGADHYHTQFIAPSWSRGQTAVASVGNHKFFRLAA